MAGAAHINSSLGILKEKINQSTYEEFKSIKINLCDPDRIGFGTDRIIPILKNEKFFIGTLMMENDEKRVNTVLRDIGLLNFLDTIDNKFNLLWYLTIAENPFGNKLNGSELAYISGLSPEELRNLLPKIYDGPSDRVSLMFAIISGTKTNIDYNNTPNYKEISKYPPPKIWSLYNYFFLSCRDQILKVFLLKYPPYVYIANLDKNVFSLAAQIAMAVDKNNVDEISKIYGIPLPPSYTPINKIIHLYNELIDYEPVLRRGELGPINIDETISNPNTLKEKLEQYTSQEIIDAFDLNELNLYRRSDILQKIRGEITNNYWFLEHTKCRNDDSITIITMEKYGELDKNDLNDPIVSYGNRFKYDCYPLSELVTSFREYDGDFKFKIPDKNDEFTLREIIELAALVETMPNSDNKTEFFRAFEKGFAFDMELKNKLKIIRTKYSKFNPDEQYLIKLFFSWLFLYGMWMRFWKGPGYPYPIMRIHNIYDEAERNKQQRCSPAERDQHSFIQQHMLSIIRETIEKDKNLNNWINDISLVQYNFSTKKSTLRDRSLKDYLDQFILGEECMGYGGDYIIETAYYYIKELLIEKNADIDQNFNNFINEMLPAITDLERQVVYYQLLTVKDPDKNIDDYDKVVEIETRNELIFNARNRYKILKERAETLGPLENPKPTPIQPPFNPTNVSYNVHT